MVGLAAVAAVGWGAGLSVRSAIRGPSWALTHLASATRVLALVVAGGVALALVLTPPWAGIGVAYVGLMAWVLAGLLRRNLRRLEEAAGGFEPVPPERRSLIVARARRSLLVAGVVLVVVGGAGIAVSGVVAGVVLALAAVLLANAVAIGRS